MPHKRAKRSVRERNKSETGADLAPAKDALSNEDIPKSAARVIFASKVQKEFRESKKRRNDDAQVGNNPGQREKKKRKVDGEGDGDTSSAMRILPGESLAHFNRRVENSMRGLVRTAVQSASAVTRKVKKAEAEAAEESKAKDSKPKHKPKSKSVSQDDILPEQSTNPKRERPTDFQSLQTSAPRRLNDIVQAPPELKKLPRKPKIALGQSMGTSSTESGSIKKSLRDGVLSMAQKVMLDEERERVIKAYREMKKRNTGPG
ncbi:hypothetical protein NLI96_g4030 [Meripilus lineatus]|uniref:Uncharacterized protein n=1 Tax=Meripilus lineatus TaxID=2056292 RepID=A0AAD5V7A4_9APHY|nr:hypothetical protein NLI96_g4030 [Physisporinus lineatus]